MTKRARAKCRHPGCDAGAVWELSPSDSFGEYCDEHVPRGCSCNIIQPRCDNPGSEQHRDDLGRLLPCVEYDHWPDGFEAGDPADVERYLTKARAARAAIEAARAAGPLVAAQVNGDSSRAEPLRNTALDDLTAETERLDLYPRPRSPQVELEPCDMCSEPHPADPDIEAITGRWLCVKCIEATLEGATHERDV